jgi:hypothetical protein
MVVSLKYTIKRRNHLNRRIKKTTQKRKKLKVFKMTRIQKLLNKQR